jgi:hypothetical protein
MNGQRDIIYVGLFLLAAAAQIPRVALADQTVVVTVPREGCHASDESNQPAYLSVWRNDQYPGSDPTMPPDHRIDQTQITIAVNPGYERLLIASDHCWEESFPFAVVAGHNRHVLARMPDWMRKPGVDYDMYASPYGALVGQLHVNQSSPRLVGEAHTYTPIVEDDKWFYFDDVGVGSYDLQVQTGSSVSHHHVTIVDNQVLTIGPPNPTPIPTATQHQISPPP